MIRRKRSIANVRKAVELDVINIYRNEIVPIALRLKDETGEEREWAGDYAMKLYQNTGKTQVLCEISVEKQGSLLRFDINPDTQDMNSGSYYYEMYNTANNRLEIYGQIRVLN